MDFLSQLKPGSKASEYHAMAVFLGFVVAVGRGDIAVPWEVVSQIALVVRIPDHPGHPFHLIPDSDSI